MKKKISIMLSFILVFSLIFSSNYNKKIAKADENAVVGAQNLNNTAANSAKVGSILTQPEIGWKRYDDVNPKITYSGIGWTVSNASAYYNSTEHRYNTSGKKTDNQIRFNFTGTKLRIIEELDQGTRINIDGIDYSISKSLYLNAQTVTFEKVDLENKEHSVIIYCTDMQSTNLDAIDIDKDGQLKTYNNVGTNVLSITLNKTTMNINIGEVNSVKATITPDNATIKTLKWISSDTSIATVDDNGNVTGIKEGTTKITVYTQDGTDLYQEYTINVKSIDEGVVGNKNLNNTAANSAKVGSILTQPEIGWKRYDDVNPKITYSGIGWTVSNASAYYNSTEHRYNTSGKKTDNQIRFNFTGTKLRIIEELDQGTRINIDGIDYSISKSLYLNAQTVTFEKVDLENKEHSVIIYCTDMQSINLDAIDIDRDGELLAYNENPEVKAKAITLDKSQLTMPVGNTANILATVTPDTATNKSVKWTSSDTSIATVDENGVVTALKVGTVKIIAITQDGTNLSAECQVDVYNQGGNSGNDNNNSAKRGLLTIYLNNGNHRSYDLSTPEIDEFISWYVNKSKGQGPALYEFKVAPISGAYSGRTEYITFDSISNFDVDQY